MMKICCNVEVEERDTTEREYKYVKTVQPKPTSDAVETYGKRHQHSTVSLQ